MLPSESSRVVALLAAAFPSANLHADTIAVYADSLRDLDAQEAIDAVRRLIATERYFPSIAIIRSNAIEARFKIPTVDSAVIELRRNLASAGQYIGLTKWSHHLLLEAAEAVGWFRLANGDNPSADFAQFAKTYESLRTQVIREHSFASAGITSNVPNLPIGQTAQALPTGSHHAG